MSLFLPHVVDEMIFVKAAAARLGIQYTAAVPAMASASVLWWTELGPSQSSHELMFRTCDYVASHDKRDFVDVVM